MLRISKMQVDALDDLMERRFEARLREAIRRLFPEALSRLDPLPDREHRLAEFMSQAVTQAQGFGMEADADVGAYIVLGLARATLDRSAMAKIEEWAQPLLERENTAGGVKMALIEYQLKELTARDATSAQLLGLIQSMRKALEPEVGSVQRAGT